MFASTKSLFTMTSNISLLHPLKIFLTINNLSRPIVIKCNKNYMHSLSPNEGSQKNKRRIARGYGGKGGGTGGRGTRGQKVRSGGGSRPGFEGGQLPLYRRLPKLKGIAGGMSRSLVDFTTVNLSDCERTFSANATVTLEELTSMKIINRTGGDKKLPLKILGRGSLNFPLVVKAEAFSVTAKLAIEAAGGRAEVIHQKSQNIRRLQSKKN